MTEELAYEVVDHLPDGVELRRYPAHGVAEVTVRGSLGGAGNIAFAPLFSYISGSNQPRSSVAMTAPVVQQPSARQPADTGRSFTVSFVLPAGMTAETAPQPADDRVSLRTVPPAVSAAVRYSGRWSASAYERHRDRLLAAVEAAGLHPVGQPRWLRFDPPFTPWFLRHNEVVVDVAEPTQP
ncbi:SOUL family heme-binding protein [Pedococcus sp. 2YAF34]|uniref:SOUL family heme-binding protein n=1 Tax=Pedococcus sp. 2YAF34 TaxID=3233032 RepID=UPI003F9743DE